MPTNQFNPMVLIQMIRNGANPQQLMLEVLQSKFKGTPLGDNLINLAQNNQTQQIEQIARNMVTAQGKDFDKEFAAFRKQFGL